MLAYIESPGPSRLTIMTALTTRRDAIEYLRYGEAASEEERQHRISKIGELRKEMQALFAKLPEDDWGADIPY